MCPTPDGIGHLRDRQPSHYDWAADLWGRVSARPRHKFDASPELGGAYDCFGTCDHRMGNCIGLDEPLRINGVTPGTLLGGAMCILLGNQYALLGDTNLPLLG